LLGWRALVKGNVGALAVISLLNDASSDMIFPLLPLFLTQSLGAGPAFLGVIEGIADSTASLLKLAGGWISDRIGRRKILAAWGYGIPAFVRPLIALATAPWHILAVRFADRIGKGLRTAPRDALLAESVPPTQRGAAFGVHRAADHAGAVIGPLIAAGILLLAPGQLRLVFALAAVPALISLVVLFAFVRDVASPSRRSGPPSLSLHGMDPAFRRFLGVLFLFTLGNASDAFLLLRVADLGIPTAIIPVLWSVLHVSKMGFSVPGGLLSDCFGPKGVIIAGWLVYTAVYSGFAFAETAWQAWALILVYGLYYGLTESPEKALVASMAPDHQRAHVFGVYHFVIGLGALPASLLFGVIWEASGPAAAFMTGATLSLMSAVLLPLALRARKG
jgi:MFS family permease